MLVRYAVGDVGMDIHIFAKTRIKCFQGDTHKLQTVRTCTLGIDAHYGYHNINTGLYAISNLASTVTTPI